MQLSGHVTQNQLGGVVRTDDGGGSVSENPCVLYADDGLFSSEIPSVLQFSVDCVVELFGRANLDCDTAKTNSRTCSPKPVKGAISEESYKQRITGDGLSYTSHQKQKPECPKCEKSLVAGYLTRYLQQIHGEEPSLMEDENYTSEKEGGAGT
jgi:hypothetical protein